AALCLRWPVPARSVASSCCSLGFSWMMSIVWSRGAFAILSTASVIALARSSFCCCVLPGYIKTLTIGIGINHAFPVQESLHGYEILFSLLTSGLMISLPRLGGPVDFSF